LACQWAEQAVTREDADGQAQTVLSHVHLLNRDYDAALAAGRAATSTRPSCANSNGFYANVLHHCGQNDDAIRHIKLAIRYHPLNPPFFRNVLSAALLARNELDGAIASARDVLEKAPNDIAARLVLISAYARSGRQDLARNMGSEVVSLDPSFTVTAFKAAQCYRDEAYLEGLADDLRLSGLPG
jgi:tetratricopeptide (TPR) repeat protein